MYNYKGFTCAKDILIYLDACKEEQEQIFDKIQNLEIKFFDPNKKKLKLEKKKLKKQLTTIRMRIQKCMKIIEDGSSFEKDDLLRFLPRYLSLKEGELYVLIEDVNADLINSSHFPNHHNMKYNVITTIHNKIKLESLKEKNRRVYDLQQYLSTCENKKYVCLSDNIRYFLLNGIDLNEFFSGYPYIRDLAFDLIDLKLENPYMSDEERLNKVLQYLQKKKRLPNNYANR